jgi:hypothetical protein
VEVPVFEQDPYNAEIKGIFDDFDYALYVGRHSDTTADLDYRLTLNRQVTLDLP